MMIAKPFTFALASLVLATTVAPAGMARSPVEPEAAAAKAPRQCFWTRQITNFASDDPNVVHVRVGVKDVYRLEMFGPCLDVDWNNQIAVVSRGGSNICSGLDAEIISPSQIGPHRCPVREVRKLTAAEIAALPKRARP
ncbi:DUF6491 family protein [Phenylobacterium sp.]|jgi:hypothetical protein|uniref:DUF6491 family protein n=1 Tax=Phenylobacterium sp. TaxID=1871053 RepID=UPI0037C5D514